MQSVEVMQKAIDVAAVAERYLVAGDLDGAGVLVELADMYVSMARELRIGNLRMTRSRNAGTPIPVYQDTLIRKTVTWDVHEPMPVPEPFSGSTGSIPEGVAPATQETAPTAPPASSEATAGPGPVIDGGEPWEGYTLGDPEGEYPQGNE